MGAFPVAARGAAASRRSQAAKAFWYDTAILGPEYTHYLIERFGADRLLAGTDGPTDVGQKNLARFVAATRGPPEQQQQICGENAQRLLAFAKGRGWRRHDVSRALRRR